MKYATTTAILLALSAPAFAGGYVTKHQFNKAFNQLNAEDMRLKSGTLSEDGSTLDFVVSDYGKSRGRNYVFTRDVSVDVSGLATDQELAMAVNDMQAKYDDLAYSIEQSEKVAAENTAGAIAISSIEFDASHRGLQAGIGYGSVDGHGVGAMAIGFGISESGYLKLSVDTNKNYGAGLSFKF